MRRLRCKVMRLTPKIITQSCGHLMYMNQRGGIIDLRMNNKDENLRKQIAYLTGQLRRNFASVKAPE
jgi:hypothetical protein